MPSCPAEQRQERRFSDEGFQCGMHDLAILEVNPAALVILYEFKRRRAAGETKNLGECQKI